MDRDAIIREWFYRLPKGYANAPYSKDEMDILHKILEENGLNGSIFINEVNQLDQGFLDAKPVEDLDEGYSWLTEQLLKETELEGRVYDIAIEEDKQGEFEHFIALLPGGEPNIAAMKFLNGLDDKILRKEFFPGLGDRPLPETTLKLSSGFEADLFNVDAKGIGKG